MIGRERLRRLIVHLRLPFQLLLAPIFLWGWLLSGGGWTASVLVAFFAFHVCLYGGATAFNSYYDRDRGPVGGLAAPPPVAPELLPFALGIKALGWLITWLVGPLVFGIYGVFVVLSVAYSHPRLRLKARPVLSLFVIGFGQGVLAFLAGWAAARGELDSVWSREGVLGAAAAALMVVGLYPLTQLFQIEEDRDRGDRTVVVAWGPRASFGLSVSCLGLGGLALACAVWWHFGALDAAGVGAGATLQVIAVGRWARRFDPHRVMANYRRVMRQNATCAAALASYLVFRLINP